MPEHLEHAIDLGDSPVGSTPLPDQAEQIRLVIGAVSDAELGAVEQKADEALSLLPKKLSKSENLSDIELPAEARASLNLWARGSGRICAKIAQMSANFRQTSRIAAVPQTLRLVDIGDSMGNRVGEQLARMMMEQLTESQDLSIEQPQSGNPLIPNNVAATITGATVLHSKSGGNPDYEAMWNGACWAMSAAGSVRWHQHASAGGKGLLCDSARIFYVAEAGAGTFSVETSTDNVTWDTAIAEVDADNSGAIAFGVANISLPGGLDRYRFRATWTGGGKVRIIGFEHNDSTRNCVRYFPTGVGSLTPSGAGEFDAMAPALAVGVLNALDADLITWMFADYDEANNPGLDLFGDWVDASGRYPSVLLLGMTTVQGLSAAEKRQNDYLQAVALERGWMFDGTIYRYPLNWTQFNAEGFANDGVHPKYTVMFTSAGRVAIDLGLYNPLYGLNAPVRTNRNTGEISLPVRAGFNFINDTGERLLSLGQNGLTSPAINPLALARGSIFANGNGAPRETITAIGTDDFSFACWCRTSATTGDHYLFRVGGNPVIGNGIGLLWRPEFSSGNLIHLLLHDGTFSAFTLSSGRSLADGNLHFVELRADRDGLATLLVDGEAWGSANISARQGAITPTFVDLFATSGVTTNWEGEVVAWSVLTRDLITDQESTAIRATPTRILQLDNVVAAIDLGSRHGRTYRNPVTGGVLRVTGGSTLPAQLGIDYAPISASQNISFGEIAAESTESTGIAVEVAEIGDTIAVQPSRIGLITLHGAVSVAGTVTVTAVNATVSAITPPATDIRVSIINN